MHTATSGKAAMGGGSAGASSREASITAAHRSPSASRVDNDGRGERVLEGLERFAEGDASSSATAVSEELPKELGEGQPTRAGGRQAGAPANSSDKEPKKTTVGRRQSLGKAVGYRLEPRRERRSGTWAKSTSASVKGQLGVGGRYVRRVGGHS